MLAPWRSGDPGRPDVPVPPQPMPLRRGTRPLKRWRWVGAFTDEVMLCAAVAHIGPLAASWWAIWDRGTRTLAEHTVRSARAVRLERSTVTVADGPASIALTIDENAGVETISPHGREYIWTRKQAAHVSGTATVGERAFTIDGPGFVDDSAGYHARHTDWRWSAGVGTTETGRPVAWNLVTGLHDAATASERTVWLDGEPHHVGPQTFAADLSAVGDLRFTAEAARVHRDNLLLVATDYEQPFGTFTGTLPVAGPLTGYGVMERHSVRW
jgi:hypothetical protein